MSTQPNGCAIPIKGRPLVSHMGRSLLAALVVASLLFAGCVTAPDNATAGDPSPSPTPADEPQQTDEPTETPTVSPSPSASPSQTPSQSASPSPTPQGETHTVEIGKTVKGPAADYTPTTITIKRGDSIVWKNLDSAVHTASADDKSFDTGSIGGGKSATAIRFDTTGTFTYYCKAHPSTMKDAKVIVEE